MITYAMVKNQKKKNFSCMILYFNILSKWKIVFISRKKTLLWKYLDASVKCRSLHTNGFLTLIVSKRNTTFVDCFETIIEIKPTVYVCIILDIDSLYFSCKK